MDAHEVIAVLLSITAVSSYINYKLIKLPKSIGITLVTLVITMLLILSDVFGWDSSKFGETFINNIGFNETFLHGMLGLLLFAGSLHIDAFEMSKYKFLIAVLATISVLISTVLIGYATYFLTNAVGITLPLYYCFAFGALISPTDAIAVISILKAAGVPKSMEIKISGEALFNDGMGIVLFFMAMALATGEQKSIDATQAILYFLREGLGGLGFGAGLGYVAAKIFETIDDFEVAIIFTLALVMGGYVMATSVLDVSGAICMATTGLVIGTSLKQSKVSKETKRQVTTFWDLVDAILNAILFVLIGLEFIRLEFDAPAIIATLGAIVITLAARWISVALPVILNSNFRAFNTGLLSILTWGGLRGGVSIALALGITGQYHDVIVSITYGVVIFSIMVQGLTMGPLIKRLSKNNSITE